MRPSQSIKNKFMTLILKQVRGDMIDFRLNSRVSTHINSTLSSPRTIVATTTFIRISRDQNLEKNRFYSEIDVVYD